MSEVTSAQVRKAQSLEFISYLPLDEYNSTV